MTPSTIEKIKYSIEALIIIVAAKDLIFKKDEKWYKRVSIWGWLLVILALCGFGSSLLESNADRIEKRNAKDESEHIRKADLRTMLDSVNAQLKPLKLHMNDKKQIIHDTLKAPIEKPFIYIGKTSVSKTRNDTIKYTIDFYNNTAFDAHNVNITAYLYSIHKHSNKQAPLGILRNFTIPKNVGFSYKNFAIIEGYKFDTCYFYIKGDYDRGRKKIDEMLIVDEKDDYMPIASPPLYDNVISRMKAQNIIK